jgi:hypothetical protein
VKTFPYKRYELKSALAIFFDNTLAEIWENYLAIRTVAIKAYRQGLHKLGIMRQKRLVGGFEDKYSYKIVTMKCCTWQPLTLNLYTSFTPDVKLIS